MDPAVIVKVEPIRRSLFDQIHFEPSQKCCPLVVTRHSEQFRDFRCRPFSALLGREHEFDAMRGYHVCGHRARSVLARSRLVAVDHGRIVADLSLVDLSPSIGLSFFSRFVWVFGHAFGDFSVSAPRAEIGREMATQPIQQPGRRFRASQPVDFDLPRASAAAQVPASHLPIRPMPLQRADVLPGQYRSFAKDSGALHFADASGFLCIAACAISSPSGEGHLSAFRAHRE